MSENRAPQILQISLEFRKYLPQIPLIPSKFPNLWTLFLQDPGLEYPKFVVALLLNNIGHHSCGICRKYFGNLDGICAIWKALFSNVELVDFTVYTFSGSWVLPGFKGYEGGGRVKILIICILKYVIALNV